MHVSDLASAHLKALDYLRAGGTSRVFNCGLGHGYSNLEVVHAVEKAVGKKIEIIKGPRREGDPVSLVSDATRIRNELKWNPQYTDIDMMVHHQLAWVQAQAQNTVV